VKVNANDIKLQMVDEEEGQSFIGDESQAIMQTRAKTLEDRLNNPILYTRGLPCSDFYLVLSGKVMVCSGNEGFMIE
jgi:CRP-like cAMP-binding protein